MFLLKNTFSHARKYAFFQQIRNPFGIKDHILSPNKYKFIRGIYNDSSTISTNTIYSLSSSATPKSAVAVIRISGESSIQALSKLTGKAIPSPRIATRRDIRDPLSNEKLDSALVLYFKEPHSFTGEDVVELHVHGGRAVIHDVLIALSRIEGLSAAKPGEFTRRAFENGKLDLTEVEGLADLLNAETEAQRKQAIRQMSGESSVVFNSWREELVKCLAYFEAMIDFGEDEHIGKDVADAIYPRVEKLLQMIESHLNDNRRGERMRGGAQIAIIGPPNAGKSSLINLLAQREAAIVSPIPGTTRDVVDVVLNFGGYPIVLSDTAGIRLEPADIIEEEGIKRAKQRFHSSDLKICMLDISSVAANGKHDVHHLNDLLDEQTIVVFNKADLLSNEQSDWLQKEIETFSQRHKTFSISLKSNEGVKEFLKGLESQVKQCFEGDNVAEEPMITRARHRELIQECVAALRVFLDQRDDVVLAAEELRYAVRAIGKLTGRVDVEQVLDVVFSDFCIGK